MARSMSISEETNNKYKDLPTFIGIGGMRCGSTWLHSVLAEHPDVFVSKQKELHFFYKNLFKHDLSWYREQFRSNGDFVQENIRGEISPSYSTLSKRTVKRMHDLLPDIKIVFTIRNPVERDWSHLLLDFSDYKRAEITELDEAKCLDYLLRRRTRYRSDYFRTIKVFRDVYGEDAILVQTFDYFKAEPDRFVANVLMHIGANASFEIPTRFRQAVHANKPIEMPDRIRWHLAENYHRPIEALNLELGGILDNWCHSIGQWRGLKEKSWSRKRFWHNSVRATPERLAYGVFEGIRDLRREIRLKSFSAE